ncbi:MAG: dUTP diphosphatase [Beijerinckiaceae bacterium]
MTLPVQIVRLPHAEGLPLPAYETAGAAGMDMRAALPENEPVMIQPLARAVIPTGLRIALPAGHEAQVRPRSGLAARHGVTVVNSPGTVDEDYRGELMVALINLGAEVFTVTRGMRIAQMVVAPVTRVIWQESDVLDATNRADGGYGSTGIR